MLFHVIVNPAGASGKTRRLWKRLEPIFKESGQAYAVHYSSEEHGIEEICRELEEGLKKKHGKTVSSGDQKEALVILGGDGSVNEAINGLKDPGAFLFGHIPAGSGNDLVRDMDLPKSPSDIGRCILKGKILRNSDIGEVKYLDTGEKRRFLISCGIGFDAAICEMSLRSKYKDALNRIGLGGLIYLFSAFRLINSQVAGNADLILDGIQKVHYERLLLLACMNHRHEGGGFQFAPAASFQDGILNLCTADPGSNLYFYLAFPFARFGKHLGLKYIHALKGSRIEVKTQYPMWVHTDGEVKRKSDHILISVVPKKLSLLE